MSTDPSAFAIPPHTCEPWDHGRAERHFALALGEKAGVALEPIGGPLAGYQSAWLPHVEWLIYVAIEDGQLTQFGLPPGWYPAAHEMVLPGYYAFEPAEESMRWHAWAWTPNDARCNVA